MYTDKEYWWMIKLMLHNFIYGFRILNFLSLFWLQTSIDIIYLLTKLLFISFFAFIKTQIIFNLFFVSLYFEATTLRIVLKRCLCTSYFVESIFHCIVCVLHFVIITVKNCRRTSLAVRNCWVSDYKEFHRLWSVSSLLRINKSKVRLFLITMILGSIQN